jgi:hypothetical protein
LPNYCLKFLPNNRRFQQISIHIEQNLWLTWDTSFNDGNVNRKLSDYPWIFSEPRAWYIGFLFVYKFIFSYPCFSINNLTKWNKNTTITSNNNTWTRAWRWSG